MRIKKSNLMSLIVNGTAHLKPMQNTGKMFSKAFLTKSKNRAWKKTDMPVVKKKKRKHLILWMNRATNTRVPPLMKHNTGFVSLQEKKEGTSRLKYTGFLNVF